MKKKCMLLPIFRRIIFSQNLIGDLLSKFSIPKKRYVVDFSSPNIAKTFHMGNFRSTVYGNFLQRVLRHAGHEVVSLNYLGDWGQQFAVLALYWMCVMDGEEGRLARPSGEQWAAMGARQRVEMLTSAYVAANRMQKLNTNFGEKVRALFLGMERHRMEASLQGRTEVDLESIPDQDVREAFRLWREWVDTSRAYLHDFYSCFGVQFDHWEAESDYIVGGARVVNEMIEAGKCRLTKDGLWAIGQPEVGPGRDKIVLRKGDGANLYLNREIGAIYARHQKYNADHYIYIVDHSQTGHFNQLKRLLEVRGDKELANRVDHLPFGRVIGLSTRQGKNDSIGFLVEQGEKEAREYVMKSYTRKADETEIDTICNKLAQSTLVFELLRRHRTSDFTFSFRGSFLADGSNALILQKKYSRLNSLELVHLDHMERIRRLNDEGDLRMKLEMNESSQRLAQRIQEFDTVILNALTKMDPNPVAIYLLKLSNQIGKSMAVLRVQDQPIAVALPRMMLFSAAKKVLGEGMRLVGIEPIDKM